MKTQLLYSLLFCLFIAGCQKSVATQENIIKELIKKYDFNHATPIATIDDVIHQHMTKNVLI